MPLWKLMYPHWKALPPVTMLLALSCLVVPIPLLQSQELYGILGYAGALENDFNSSYRLNIPTRTGGFSP